jgi:hypothetical protein
VSQGPNAGAAGPASRLADAEDRLAAEWPDIFLGTGLPPLQRLLAGPDSHGVFGLFHHAGEMWVGLDVAALRRAAKGRAGVQGTDTFVVAQVSPRCRPCRLPRCAWPTEARTTHRANACACFAATPFACFAATPCACRSGASTHPCC